VRGGVKGPALVRWIAGRVEERALTVAWTDVGSVDSEVHVRRRADELVRLGDAVRSWS
jgi:hypothetical protein